MYARTPQRNPALERGAVRAWFNRSLLGARLGQRGLRVAMTITSNESMSWSWADVC